MLLNVLLYLPKMEEPDQSLSSHFSELCLQQATLSRVTACFEMASSPSPVISPPRPIIQPTVLIQEKFNQVHICQVHCNEL
jgi:hypothetical protein